MNIFHKAGTKTAILLCLTLMWGALGNAQANSKFVTIGVVIDDPSFSEHLHWFKTYMAEFGYLEDKNIRYIFYGLVENDNRINDIETEKAISDNPDIIFTVGNHSALWAKKAVNGTDIPALFCMINSDPVYEGMVESLSSPKGNITGLRVPEIILKALEWLMATVPGIKKVYVPYNPVDEISVIALKELEGATSMLSVELIVQKINSADEAIAAIEELPGDVDAIFRIPSQTLDPRSNDLNQAAIKRKIPMGAANKQDESVLITFRPDIVQAGRQAARLANQILRGVRPADLPIETLEVTLTVNLKIAEQIGIQIPNAVLVNANKIIR